MNLSTMEETRQQPATKEAERETPRERIERLREELDQMNREEDESGALLDLFRKILNR